jgi:hypothetical protein
LQLKKGAAGLEPATLGIPFCGSTAARVPHCLANEHIVGFSPFYNYNFDSGIFLFNNLNNFIVGFVFGI